MTKSIHFGRRSTADKVLAGIDLSGKRILVTGCNTGLGLETMNAFAANGATVIGLARTIQAATMSCAQASPLCIPVACDLADLESVAAAVRTIGDIVGPLDAIVANAGVANLPSLDTRYGIEMHFMANHIGHFALINGLADLLRDNGGRVVLVSSGAGIEHAPAEGIMFDNLDGHRFYDPSTFYGQSKLANALYAKELSRRLSNRGIAVNSVDPGAARTRINKGYFARLFSKSAAQAASTQALVAASPQASGITGQYWSDCRIATGSPLLDDVVLAKRLWDVSDDIVARRSSQGKASLQRAA
ncbi:MAG: SDR family NAD(P)-dependent oxidoreductase [Pseudomonadota bacterium]|nr:SDR family NAD(P)-dependent oxidoreductase [Pseudomonadota bacterium]